MPRRNKNAKSYKKSLLSFRKLCQMVGLTPKERILMVRYMKRNLKEVN